MFTKSGDTLRIYANPIPRIIAPMVTTIRSLGLVIRFSKKLRKKPRAKPTARESRIPPKDEKRANKNGVKDSSGARVIIGKQRVNRIKHTILFKPVRVMSESVTTPSESYSLRTRIVAAGAVAMAKIARQMDSFVFWVKIIRGINTKRKVRTVSQREMVSILLPIFLKRSCLNSPPILKAISPSASSLTKRRSLSELSRLWEKTFEKIPTTDGLRIIPAKR
jgi:hypothetical protein